MGPGISEDITSSIFSRIDRCCLRREICVHEEDHASETQHACQRYCHDEAPELPKHLIEIQEAKPSLGGHAKFPFESRPNRVGGKVNKEGSEQSLWRKR
jgi:hypothetical protein